MRAGIGEYFPKSFHRRISQLPVGVYAILIEQHLYFRADSLHDGQIILNTGTAPPLKVLDVLIELFNTLHTSLEKTVSHKTRQERAQFLRRFFRDLSLKAGFKMAPDPRNLGQKHIHAMVQVWHDECLAPATIQTYLSFLRGLAMWMGKPGFVRGPPH